MDGTTGSQRRSSATSSAFPRQLTKGESNSPLAYRRVGSERLDNVRIGDQRIDLAIAIDKDRGEVKLEVNGPGSDWTIEGGGPRWYGLSPGDYTLSLNGEAHVEIRPGQPSPVAFEWRSRGRNLVVLSSSGTGS